MGDSPSSPIPLPPGFREALERHKGLVERAMRAFAEGGLEAMMEAVLSDPELPALEDELSEAATREPGYGEEAEVKGFLEGPALARRLAEVARNG